MAMAAVSILLPLYSASVQFVAIKYSLFSQDVLYHSKVTCGPQRVFYIITFGLLLSRTTNQVHIRKYIVILFYACLCMPVQG